MRRLLLVVLLALALPAPARAASVPTGPLEGGPILVEDGVIWLQRTGVRSSAVMGGRPNGTARRLRAEYASSFSSDGTVAVLTIDSQLWTATVGGGLRPVAPLPKACTPTAAELDGGVMAVACGGYENYTVVLRRPGAPDTTFEAGRAGVAVAGRYAAWTSRNQAVGAGIVLYDVRAGREVVRAARSRGTSAYPLTLQPDGTMLVGTGGAFEDTGVGWVSPASPSLHPLDVPLESVRGFARNRVLSLEDDRDSSLWSVSTGASLVGLDGSRRRVASMRGTGRIVGAHYDGERIALANATCNGSRILFRNPTGPAFAPPAPRLCTLIITSPPVLEFNTRDRPRVGLEVRCPERTLRVCGELVLRGSDGVTLSESSYRPNLDGNYNVYLTDTAVRRIARDRSLPLRVEMHDDDGRPLQSPRTATLRVEPEELARLRRCLRARKLPARGPCPD
jgi:hypothetical protein